MHENIIKNITAKAEVWRVIRFLIALRTNFHLHTDILNTSEGEKLQVCLDSLCKGSQNDSLWAPPGPIPQFYQKKMKQNWTFSALVLFHLAGWSAFALRQM